MKGTFRPARRGGQRLVTAVVSLLVAALPAAGHHSNSSYDTSDSRELQGTLEHATVGNPHSRFEVSVPGEGGTVLWTVETGGKAYVLRAIGGQLRDQFAAGQKVRVSVHPRRDGTPNGLLVQMRFADGRVLDGIPLP